MQPCTQQNNHATLQHCNTTITQALTQQSRNLATQQCAVSSERDSFAKGDFYTFAKGFLLHKLLLKVNYSPLKG
jgi:hypothetical protein